MESVKPEPYYKMYIAVHDDVPDYMAPTLVAHSVLGAHLEFQDHISPNYALWLSESFRKAVVRVNQKEFDKIVDTLTCYLGHENTVMDAKKSCAVVIPVLSDQVPNVLKFAKLWKPKVEIA